MHLKVYAYLCAFYLWRKTMCNIISSRFLLYVCWMSTCVYMYIHTSIGKNTRVHVHAQMCRCASTNVSMCVHTCTFTYTYQHMYMCMHTYTHAWLVIMHVYLFTFIFIRVTLVFWNILSYKGLFNKCFTKNMHLLHVISLLISYPTTYFILYAHFFSLSLPPLNIFYFWIV